MRKDHQDYIDDKIFIEACRTSDIETVKKMIEESPGRLNREYRTARRSTTPLIEACEKDDIEMIKLLLSHAADPNYVRVSPGYAVILSGHRRIHFPLNSCRSLEAVKLLVSAGASVNPEQEGVNPLQYPILKHREKYDIFSFLIDSGADIHGLYNHFGRLCRKHLFTILFEDLVAQAYKIGHADIKTIRKLFDIGYSKDRAQQELADLMSDYEKLFEDGYISEKSFRDAFSVGLKCSSILF